MITKKKFAANGYVLKKLSQIRKKRDLELLGLLTLGAVFTSTLLAGVGLVVLSEYSKEVPTKSQIQARLLDKGENSKIFDRNGNLLYTFKDPVRDREYAEFEEIPSTVIAAALAAEDKDFFIHSGFDFLGTLKAGISSIASNGETLTSGSTITQQLVKQTLLTSDKTFERKVKEAILTLMVEQQYSKEEILEFYLNNSSYGGRVQGIKTAAITYFKKQLKDINLNEAAFLMSLVRSPGEYSPLFAYNQEQAEELSDKRRQFVLGQVIENERLLSYLNTGDIAELSAREVTNAAFGQTYTIDTVAKFQDERLKFKPFTDVIRAPHWVFYIRDILQQEPYNLSVDDLYSGGYTIVTSLDIGIQELAERKVREEVDRIGGWYGFANGALVAIDATNGQILAMVGSKGYNLTRSGDGKFDPKVNVTTSLNSLGSSLKPWVVYLAFNSGKYSPSTTVYDKPRTFYGTYKPKNSDNKFYGEMTIREALLRSRNLPMLGLSYDIGDWRLPDLMEKIGYRPNNQYGLAATIGGVDESLLSHTAAYTGLANGGTVYNISPVLFIKNRTGDKIFKSHPEVNYELNRKATATVNSILGDKSYSAGLNARKFIGGRKLAGKTGTSDGNKDTFYMGYGPKVVVGVWTGNNNNARMSGRAFGSTTAILVWNSFMRDFLRQYPQYASWGSY